jgi:hypothetical protein
MTALSANATTFVHLSMNDITYVIGFVYVTLFYVDLCTRQAGVALAHDAQLLERKAPARVG